MRETDGVEECVNQSLTGKSRGLQILPVLESDLVRFAEHSLFALNPKMANIIFMETKIYEILKWSFC